MRLKPIFMTLIFLDFAAVTVWALASGSLFELVEIAGTHPWAIQIALDLCIALGFAGYALFRDARAKGLNPWPWLIAIPFTGSLSVLLYAVRRAWMDAEPSRRTVVAAA